MARARHEAAGGGSAPSSRWSGFYRDSLADRRARIAASGLLSPPSFALLASGGSLPLAIADRMSENVIGLHGLPLAVALNFRVNQRDVLVPMAIEEPSVVAAASGAALLCRARGGFTASASPSIMTAQVQFDDVPAVAAVAARVAAIRAEVLAVADRAIPAMVARGGGARDLEVRVLDASAGVVVVDLFVDVGDAMGANLVDTVAEAVAPALHRVVGGTLGLRILSNLPLRRLVRVTAQVGEAALGGADAAAAIARASRFAELDPLRAVTHNKGVMNGIDAVAVALGQDFRAIEAGAHGFAARGGYHPLATWRQADGALVGVLELPLAVGVVGGATAVHPGVRAALELVAVGSAGELAMVMAAAGLAANLAALRALAGEGIQRGHMRLHRRRFELADAVSAGASRAEDDHELG